MIGVMETPLACVENAPSISRQCNDVVLHLSEFHLFSFVKVLELARISTSIDQLSTFQKLYLTRCSNLRKLFTFIGQLNPL